MWLQSAQNIYEQHFALVFMNSPVFCPVRSIDKVELIETLAFLGSLGIFTLDFFHCFPHLLWNQKRAGLGPESLHVSRGLGRLVRPCFLSPPAPWNRYGKYEYCFLLKVCHFTNFLLKSMAESHGMSHMEAALPEIFRVESMSLYMTGTDLGIFCRIPISVFNKSVYCRAFDRDGLVKIRNPEVFPEFSVLVLILTVVKP